MNAINIFFNSYILSKEEMLSKSLKPVIPLLRFSEFSEVWYKKKLGDIADARDGTHDSPKFVSEGYKLVTSKNLGKDGKLDLENVNLISQDDFDKINKRSKVARGDILFGMIGTIGNPVLLQNDGFAIKNVALIKEEKTLLNIYLINYLKSNNIKRQFYKENTGGTQKFLSLNVIRNLDISYPSRIEQQKIASFLSSVDNWIQNLEKQKASLEAYKKGTMQKIFSQEIRFRDDDGSEYPEWEEIRLGSVATIIKGKGISKNDIHSNGKNKCIRYGELYTEYSELIDKVISRTDINTDKMIFSKENDMLMPTSDVTPSGLATCSALDEENVILGGDIMIIRSSRLHNLFFSYYVTANKKAIMKLVSGVTVYHIYGSDLEKLFINLPQIYEQKKIASFLSSIDKQINSIATQINQAKKWKKGLLQQMLI